MGSDVFSLATDLIKYTDRSVFLTGKAGTGKTTFLRNIKSLNLKNMVVVAPTGVAAINAGGVTIHSFFQLPFGLYVRDADVYEESSSIYNHTYLIRKLRFNRDKLNTFRALDLLVIDEVSMLRSDVLDAIDAVLRHVRKNIHDPFGGVQVLYIGDLFQLPPVVQRDEWNQMKRYYSSEFFFDAQVIQDQQPLVIELDKVYRQTDDVFIDLLNKVRVNTLTTDDLSHLNERFNPHFEPETSDSYITLTTHNRSADEINSTELSRLKTKPHDYYAQISGDFKEYLYPVDPHLTLKEGAKVMFVKNDVSFDKKYYNGKMAIVTRLGKDTIEVQFFDSKEHFEVPIERWDNIKYTWNADTGKMEEESIGTFVHYPLRLAWAITVHKSQGLTFDKLIVDSGRAFAAGQVYVALSRATSLQGMVLSSKINASAVKTDERVIQFVHQVQQPNDISSIIQNDKPKFEVKLVKRFFDFNLLKYHYKEFVKYVKITEWEAPSAILTPILQTQDVVDEIHTTSTRFHRQLDEMLATHEVLSVALLKERVGKAVAYFSELIGEKVLMPIKDHLSNAQVKTKGRPYHKEVEQFYTSIWEILLHMHHVKTVDIQLLDTSVDIQKYRPDFDRDNKLGNATTSKASKGESSRITLEMFKSGKTIAEIALERAFAQTTIEGHLAQCVATKELSVYELVDKSVVDLILTEITTTEFQSLKELKEKLGDSYTYAQIKFVIEHSKALKQG